MKLILGSGSKGRQDVLKAAGYNFTVVTADIDERSIMQSDPRQRALSVAHAKADVLAQKILEPVLLITADQVVVCDGVIRGKPENTDQAREFIRSYGKYPMETVSAVVVTNTATGKRAEGIDVARIFFHPIPENVIEEAIAIGRVLHCAGAMRCEDPPLSAFVSRFEGTKDSTSGLPLALLRRLVRDVSLESTT